ncbi:hypothetical protein LOD99_14596 [Oopsacas minuta]|uniref:Uncharacterized protein n=1 Tax=Oopsacas minuta TaxID=111878 RepID=A0AAV7KES9_9METZ|nr:hypothetical protein LOD99_14596 [Oopsacas minuta]
MRPKSSASSVSGGLGGGVRKRPTPQVIIPPGVKINAVKYQELVLDPIVRGLVRPSSIIVHFIPARRCACSHSESQPTVVTRHYPRLHLQGGMASFQPRSQPNGLLVVIDIGHKYVLYFPQECQFSKNVFLPRMGKIPQEQLRAAVESVPKWLRTIINKKGSYIEQLKIL